MVAFVTRQNLTPFIEPPLHITFLFSCGPSGVSIRLGEVQNELQQFVMTFYPNSEQRSRIADAVEFTAYVATCSDIALA